MSTIPASVRAAGDDRIRRVWWESTRLWAGASIAAMWTAVLVTAVAGPDFVSESGGSRTVIPSVILVAICAMVATMTVARIALRDGGGSAGDAPTG